MEGYDDAVRMGSSATSKRYVTTQGEEQSTRSSIMLHEPDTASGIGLKRRSLAHDLRMRQQYKDTIYQERVINQAELASALSELEAESPLTALHAPRQQAIVNKMKASAKNILR